MATEYLHIVFDGPPGPEAGRFVECENPAGYSINVGEWSERSDGLWELIIPTTSQDATTALEAENAALRAQIETCKSNLANAVKRLTVQDSEVGDAGQLRINCDKGLVHVLLARQALGQPHEEHRQ